MKKYIVITSIFPPTVSVKRYAAIEDHTTIIVADLKTPKDWSCKNVIFLSVAEQKRNNKFKKQLPFNHYARKMTGYLHAIEKGAELIIDTDDDNTPLSHWNFPSFSESHNTIYSDSQFINIYKLFTKQHIWPRGFPLQYVNGEQLIKSNKKKIKVGIWQGLADNDPDVDAIYRMTNNQPPCYFDRNSPVVLQKGNVCPFNSQNTAVVKELFPLLYLPGYVSFRFTDILRGLIAQPIMWLYDYHLGFTNATVIQERNPHNYLKDFESEIPCYLYSEKIINLVTKAIKSKHTLTDNLHNAYDELTRNNITQNKEMQLLECWINNIH